MCCEQEIDQMKRIVARKEEEMLRRHANEKRRLPKLQKNDLKTRQQLFKQSLRISGINNSDDIHDKVRSVRRPFSIV